MEFKGSKGKWYTVEYAGKIFIQNGDSYEDLDILDIEHVGNEYKANALLISKAPELLEMLQLLVTQHDLGNEIGQYDKARELIKEATIL